MKIILITLTIIVSSLINNCNCQTTIDTDSMMSEIHQFLIEKGSIDSITNQKLIFLSELNSHKKYNNGDKGFFKISTLSSSVNQHLIYICTNNYVILDMDKPFICIIEEANTLLLKDVTVSKELALQYVNHIIQLYKINDNSKWSTE